MKYPDTRLIRPSSPSFFKYGSLEHTERLKQILIDNQFYFSTQSQLNDPDECLPIFSYDRPLEELLNYLCAVHLEENPNTTAARLEKIREDWRLKGKNRLIEEFGKIFINMFRDKTGILSLSMDGENTVLWAHYGDNHKGYCLEICNDPSIQCFEVIYDEKTPFEPSANLDARSLEYLYTKQPAWSYEKEVRVIDVPGPKSFPPEWILSITLGRYISKENKMKVLGWISRNPIQVTVKQAFYNESTQKLEYSVIDLTGI